MHICNSSIENTEVAGWGAVATMTDAIKSSGQPGMHRKFQASQGFVAKFCLNRQTKETFQVSLPTLSLLPGPRWLHSCDEREHLGEERSK